MSQPYNPYAAPHAAPAVPSNSGASGQPLPWTPAEVIRVGTAGLTHWLVLLCAFLIYFAFSQGVGQGPVLLMRLSSPGSEKTGLGIAVQFVSSLVGIAAGAFFIVGLLRMYLDAARGKAPQLGTLFTGADRFLPMLGLYLLMSFIFCVGFVLFVVPGVIAMLGLSFAPMYLVDADLGPIEAMRASWEATKGQKGKLFTLGILSFGVMVAGVIACGVGIIPASLVVYIAWAATFTRVSGREPANLAPAPR